MNVCAIEVSADGVKAQFFPPMPEHVEMPRPEEPKPPSARDVPNPDATLLALQAQSGRG